MGIGHAMCDYCGVVEETVLHAMRDCSLAMHMWLNMVKLEDRESFFSSDLHPMDSF
jgi:hypothetical protein